MKRILIIDDDSIYRMLHKRMLELTKIPVQIFTASNALDALVFIRSWWAEFNLLPDVILLDLMMPGIDGFEFISQFRKITHPGIENVNLVVLSSSSDKRDLLRAQELGVDSYIVKPVSFENLKETIST